ncbi:MAG: sigma-54-dependent Fis family transcriptional regulator [Kiritimatiellae bacterium]|nr:sigma-54-dependent Fis family transcriptional regulator [Kiritimatiellia bacterium]
MAADKPKILVVDDEKPTRDVMARILSSSYECLTAPDAEAAMKTIEGAPDLALVITDYKMPGMNGVELIKKAKAANPAIACILVTAYGEIELAVEAMKDGADDFLTKPITDLNQLELRVSKAIKTKNLERQVDELKSELDIRYDLESFTGTSAEMEKVYKLIRKVAPTGANVLIEGPSGSGKELAARAIHKLSRRAAGPFIAVECSALPASLLETELFGSTKGAYTDARDRAGCFESADGGTIFLDEIGEIDLAVQVKLLRVLETHTFQRVGETAARKSDFRLVAATNKDLASLVAKGDFREDLYYRLNVIDIKMPPLKERPGDIALLASRFLKEFSAANGNAVKGIDPQAMRALEQYSWPGNVRQLRNVIEKMVVLSSGGKLTLDDVPVEILNSPAPDAAAAGSAPSAPPTLAQNERALYEAAIKEAGGNITKAAERLGVSRRTIQRHLKEWRSKAQ